MVLKQLEGCPYQTVQIVWRYVQSFRHNTSVLQMDERMDRNGRRNPAVRDKPRNAFVQCAVALTP